MYKDDVISEISKIETDLRAMGVRSVRLFGSVARGQETAFSDVDLALDVDKDGGFSLLNLVAVKDFIASRLGKSVDVVTFPIRRVDLLNEIERDSIRAF
ncbi:nucleotidyltransferase domain-containing protein [Ochrobactrum sp. S1502_03]|uniref:nucleotidyltransferase family protein n=1 Tax=Ochrobactrum sp. S1502_03 TaxID=3108451 RepID=UPI000EFA79B3